MSRQLFEIEKGLLISNPNSDGEVAVLFGASAPLGGGDQDAVAKGSIYLRTATGQTYSKTNDAGGPGDWELSASGIIPVFSDKVVRAVTSQAPIAGNIYDPTAFPDNDGSIDGNDFQVGDYLILRYNNIPILSEVVTVTSATSITLNAVPETLTPNEGFVTQHFLPDPAGQEGKALIVYSGNEMVKLSDVNWDFATGINLSAGMNPNINGLVTTADTVESAIEKLSGNQKDLTTLTGVGQGSTDNGAFTGTIIPDGRTTKQALQDLETFAESEASDMNEIDANVDDLITLSGVTENATNLGAFPGGTIISDFNTNKGALAELDTELTKQKGYISATGVTLPQDLIVDLVDEIESMQLLVTISLNSAPERKRQFVMYVGHDGHSGADATASDDTIYAKLKYGTNFNYDVTAFVNGTGITQDLRVRFQSTEPGGIDVRIKKIEQLF